MADEQESIAPLPELDTPAIAATAEVETEDTSEDLPVDTDPGDTEGDEGSDEGGEPTAPEMTTILGDDGIEYQVPKSLEGMFLKNKDYTTKTQTVAEKAKELEAREAAITQQAEATEAELDARAKLRSVSEQLAAYEKLTPEDWNAHEMQDPIGTRQHERAFQHLKNQKAELEGTLGKAQTERTEKAQQDLAKRVQETLEAAPKIIPGLTPEIRGATIDKLVAFATSEGIPEQVLKANWSPVLLGLLHKAHIGAQAIAKQSAPKPTPQTASVTPLVTVKAAASPTTAKSVADLAKGDDMAAYAAARASGKRR